MKLEADIKAAKLLLHQYTHRETKAFAPDQAQFKRYQELIGVDFHSKSIKENLCPRVAHGEYTSREDGAVTRAWPGTVVGSSV